jgi:ferrous iron transport protein B
MHTNNESTPVIALAGNPNVGKSTLFNALTGLKQHTGNWPGKTVLRAEGLFTFKNISYKVIDLPGTYSLLANSLEEKIARDFLCFHNPDVTLIITDATCLERNLNLVLQVLEIASNSIVCVNLIDEAKRKKIEVNTNILEYELGVPVVKMSARNGEGLSILKEKIHDLYNKNIKVIPKQVVYDSEIEYYISNIQHNIIQQTKGKLNPRWVALRLIEGNQNIIESINEYIGTSIITPNIEEILS